jgi:hypothetical protein
MDIQASGFPIQGGHREVGSCLEGVILLVNHVVQDVLRDSHSEKRRPQQYMHDSQEAACYT